MKQKNGSSVRMIENRMVDPNAFAACYDGADYGDTKERERAAYKETEKRLFALRALQARMAETKEELGELESLGLDALKAHSASLVRVLRPGMRLEPEEVHRMQLEMLRARLAADEREWKRMRIALDFIRDDPYYLTVEARYLKGMGDGDVALRLCCDPSTVRRNRVRLVRTLALRLYGVGGMLCVNSF
ncbi:MAG: hypothetical protein E7330_03560 [Clostridiales bacterium]|nr:hypothetical protein [Clostridiales bacterium]